MISYVKLIKENYKEGDKSFEKTNCVVSQEEESVLIDMLKKGEIHISQIFNPSIGIQKEALKISAADMRFISNLDRSLKFNILKQYPYGIQYIFEPEERHKLQAVKTNGMVLEFIENPSENVRRAALKQNPFAAEFLDDFTKEEIDIILENGPEALRFVKNLSFDTLKKAIQNKPNAIIVFTKCGLVKRVSEAFKTDNYNHLELWTAALRKDPYLSFFLSEYEQVGMIHVIIIGIIKDLRAITQLKPNIQKAVIDTIQEYQIGTQEFMDALEQKAFAIDKALKED